MNTETNGPPVMRASSSRVFAFGQFLRATCLDDLPQLWNVLVGDMSLVGPRPMSVSDASLFARSSVARRFSVRPGMTGLWQVSGRSSVCFDQWLSLDNTYIDKRSIALDMKILVLTIGSLIKRSRSV